MDERYERFMERAAEISALRLARKVGRREQVIVDRIEDGVATARTRGDAPEIDGTVAVHGAQRLRVGEFADVLIESADVYDLTARPA
jgi:ribosomal protein S12 methylthiotransferase